MNIDAPPRNNARCIVDEKKYECTGLLRNPPWMLS